MPDDEEVAPQEEQQTPEKEVKQTKTAKKHKAKHKAKTPVAPPKAPKKEKSAGSSGLALIVVYILLGILVIATSFYTGYLIGKTGGVGNVGTQTGSGTNAKLQIIAYSDYQCPFCGRVEPTIAQLKKDYGDKIEIVFKNFPLESIHPNALNAAIAAECARKQGDEKFWAYHDTLFQNQQSLDVASLKKFAADLKLDTGKFNTCLDNKETEAIVRADAQEAQAKGVQGTPSFWIKDELFVGAQPVDKFKAKIDEKLSGKAATPPPAAQQPQAPAPTNVPKSDKPKVELFVMSYCPYGLQMEKAYVPVAKLLGNKADMQIHYVSYAMHGEKEVTENLRQYCIQKEQSTKYLDYLQCFVEATNTDDCLTKTGIDKTALQKCYDTSDKQFNVMANFNDKASWLSGQFPKFDIDKTLCDKYQVQGSPTLIINGVEASVSRSQEALKKAVCDAFNTAPAECQQTLSVNQENPGPGPIGAGTQAAAAGAAAGDCG